MKSMKTIMASLAAVGLIAACGGGSSSGASGANISTAKTCPAGIQYALRDYLTEEGEQNIASGAYMQMKSLEWEWYDGENVQDFQDSAQIIFQAGDLDGSGLDIPEVIQDADGNSYNLSILPWIGYGYYIISIIYSFDDIGSDPYFDKNAYLLNYNHDLGLWGVSRDIDSIETSIGYDQLSGIDLDKFDVLLGLAYEKVVKTAEDVLAFEAQQNELNALQRDKDTLESEKQELIDDLTQLGLDHTLAVDELMTEIETLQTDLQYSHEDINYAWEYANHLQAQLSQGVIDLSDTEMSNACLQLVMDNVLLDEYKHWENLDEEDWATYEATYDYDPKKEVRKLDFSGNEWFDKESLRIVLDATLKLTQFENEYSSWWDIGGGYSLQEIDLSGTSVTWDDYNELMSEVVDRNGEEVQKYQNMEALMIMIDADYDLEGMGDYPTEDFDTDQY